MDRITYQQIPELFREVAEVFSEKKEELCGMDAKMGDGDLGLTMSKGYQALTELIAQNLDAGDLGKTLMIAGMKMASVVPSTMGTLMASGVMDGGKALKGRTEFDAEGFVLYLEGFAEGIRKRGKCQLGDCTIYDAVFEGALQARQSYDAGRKTLIEIADAALTGAQEGVRSTRDMIPKFGKAAVFADRAHGVEDQGAVAGMYMIMGFQRYIKSQSEI